MHPFCETELGVVGRCAQDIHQVSSPSVSWHRRWEGGCLNLLLRRRQTVVAPPPSEKKTQMRSWCEDVTCLYLLPPRHIQKTPTQGFWRSEVQVRRLLIPICKTGFDSIVMVRYVHFWSSQVSIFIIVSRWRQHYSFNDPQSLSFFLKSSVK